MAILLFDGECNLCQFSVQFILKNESIDTIQFCSLQSKTGQILISDYPVPEQIDSIIFIEDTRLFLKSDAVLRIIRYLKPEWRILILAGICPRYIRDRVYDWVARNRYKWFGRTETCLIPNPKIRNRFME